MEQYLLELIKTNNRVIVPNFGAFIVSRDAGTTVLFNNFLSFNDGLLINHVSKKEDIDTHEATRKVSDLVDNIKQELDKNGEYTIEKLGSFTKDQNGILRFTQDPHLAALLPDEKPKEKKPEEDMALLDIDNEEPPEKTKKSTDDKKRNAEPKKSPASEGKKKTQPVQKEKEVRGKKEKVAVSAQKKEFEPQKSKAPSAPVIEAGKTQKDEGKRSFLPPWLIGLIILIPVVVILLYLFWWRDRDKREEQTKDPIGIVDTMPKQPAIDSAAIKKAEEERLRKEEEARKQEEAQKGSLRGHHIIVGSFKNEANARNLVNDLKSKGFENAFSFREKGLTMVSAESHESLVKAREAQEKLLQEQRLENWILTKK